MGTLSQGQQMDQGQVCVWGGGGLTQSGDES